MSTLLLLELIKSQYPVRMVRYRTIFYYYYAENPEEVNEIRNIGIFPCDNRGVIEITASMQDTNHIAYDRLKTNKYGANAQIIIGQKLLKPAEVGVWQE